MKSAFLPLVSLRNFSYASRTAASTRSRLGATGLLLVCAERGPAQTPASRRYAARTNVPIRELILNICFLRNCDQSIVAFLKLRDGRSSLRVDTRLELKAFAPVIAEGELHLVIVCIEAIGEIHSPSKLKFAAHRHLFYGMVEKISQGIVSLVIGSRGHSVGVVDIHH